MLRIGLGLTLFVLGISGLFSEPLAAALRISSIIPFATGGLGWSPLYELLGINTRQSRRSTKVEVLPSRTEERAGTGRTAA